MKIIGTLIIATELKEGKKKQLGGIVTFTTNKKEINKIKNKLRKRYERKGHIFKD